MSADIRARVVRGVSDHDGPANKAERLALAARVAPTLRDGAAKAKGRRVNITRGNSDEVVRVGTLDEVISGVLATCKIEIDVADGVRPTAIICEGCRLPTAVPERGRFHKRCPSCMVLRGRTDGESQSALLANRRIRLQDWRDICKVAKTRGYHFGWAEFRFRELHGTPPPSASES